MEALTDEERKKLIIMLRAARPGYPPGELCVLAAEEIERLDKAWREWRSIAERLRDDLRTGKRAYDFSFLGEKFLTL